MPEETTKTKTEETVPEHDVKTTETKTEKVPEKQVTTEETVAE